MWSQASDEYGGSGVTSGWETVKPLGHGHRASAFRRRMECGFVQERIPIGAKFFPTWDVGRVDYRTCGGFRALPFAKALCFLTRLSATGLAM